MLATMYVDQRENYLERKPHHSYSITLEVHWRKIFKRNFSNNTMKKHGQSIVDEYAD